MPQIKTKRKQEKLFRKIKIVSLLASFFMVLAIGEIIYQNYFKNSALFLSPLSDATNSKIEDTLRNKNILYAHLEEHPSYYILVLQTKETVTISKSKSIEEQLSSLQLIQSRLKIEGKEFKSLDLRFSQPVIK